MIRNQYRPAAQPQGRTPRQSCAHPPRANIARTIAREICEIQGAGLPVSLEDIASRMNCSTKVVARLAPAAVLLARRASVRRIER